MYIHEDAALFILPRCLGTPAQDTYFPNLSEEERAHALLYPEGTIAAAVLCDKTAAVRLARCRFDLCP